MVFRSICKLLFCVASSIWWITYECNHEGFMADAQKKTLNKIKIQIEKINSSYALSCFVKIFRGCTRRMVVEQNNLLTSLICIWCKCMQRGRARGSKYSENHSDMTVNSPFLKCTKNIKDTNGVHKFETGLHCDCLWPLFDPKTKWPQEGAKGCMRFLCWLH